MAETASEVFVAGDGHVWVAPEATSFPTAAKPFTAPSSTWKELGYITEDGVTFSRSRQEDDLRVWQSTEPVRKLITGADSTLAFTLRQFNPNNVITAFGGGTFVAGDSTHPGVLTLPAPSDIAVMAMIIEGIDGSDAVRMLIERVQVGGDIEINLQAGDSMNLPVTFNVLSSTNPIKFQSTDAAWLA